MQSDHICFRTRLTADTSEYPSRGSVLGLGKWVITQQQSKNLQARTLFWKYRCVLLTNIHFSKQSTHRKLATHALYMHAQVFYNARSVAVLSACMLQAMLCSNGCGRSSSLASDCNIFPFPVFLLLLFGESGIDVLASRLSGSL